MKDKIEHFDLLRITGLKRQDKRDRKYATFNRRMMAVTVDSLLALPLMLSLSDMLYPVDLTAMRGELNAMAMTQELSLGGLFSLMHKYGWFGNALAQVIIFCLASGVCWHFWSATPGKMLLRIKVVDAVTEQPISTKQNILRMVGYLVSGFVLMLGIIWIGIDKRRQGWHDKIANTVVVTVPWKIRSNSAAAGPSDSQAPSAAE